MNKSVHPLVALGVVVFFGSLLGIKFWCDHQYLTMDRLLGIKLSPQNEIVVQLGSRLIFSAQDGAHLRTLDFHDLGITNFVGDFAFFNNGDLLIAHNRLGLGAAENLQVALRQTAPERHGKDSRLHRCSLQTMDCREFSDLLPDFSRTFKLFIDPNDERVYIADTSRHQLWLLDMDGNLLARQTGFKFPNQLARIGDHLWLADTNYHHIKKLDLQTDNFAEELAHYDVQLAAPYRWPFAFAQMNNRWWVMIANNGMANARLMIYSTDWIGAEEVSLPDSADPVAFLAVENRVLITDNRLFRIYQFDVQGMPLPDYIPVAIAAELEELREVASQWKFYSRLALAAFVITFIISFAFALRQHFSDKREAEAKIHKAGRPTFAELTEGLWLNASGYFRVLPILLAITSLLLISIMFFIDVFREPSAKLYYMYFFPVALLITIVPFWRLGRIRLGLFEDRVEIISYTGQRYTCAYHQLLWTPMAIIVGNQVVPLGDGRRVGLFPAKVLNKYLRPYLLHENKLSPLKMFRYQWHSPEGLQKALLIMMTLLGIVYIVGMSAH